MSVTCHDCPEGRVGKPHGYAAAGIPVHLLIDRETGSVTVYADPQKGAYRSVTTRAFGVASELPEPVGFTPETDELKEFAD